MLRYILFAMKKLFTLVALAVMMFSCTKNDEATQNAEKFPINISVGQQTRANDTDFENGDEVGIYVVNYNGSTAGTLAASGNQVDNVQFVYDGSKWTPEESIYWKDKNTAADFYAYYPYSASANIAAHPFSVQANQSTEDAFWASDFLWGKTTKVSPTPNAVAIQTNHSLSRILVDIKPGNGFTAESWAAATKSVKICNVKTSATIDLSTGVATATGNNGEITPLAVAGTGSTLSYKAMMIPQLVANNSKLVVITIDGTEYVYRKGYTFSPNTIHKFTVTVNKNGSNVSVTIGEWNIDTTVNEGTAVEETNTSTTILNNEIWYKNGSTTVATSPGINQFGDATITSNTYNSATGYWVIKFDKDVTEISRLSFSSKTSLTSVMLPNSITKIDTSTFNRCSSLSEINIPEGVTKIGNSAFYVCTSLTSITLPASLTDLGGGYQFEECSNLAYVYCKATSPPYGPIGAFNGCSSNLKIYVPKISVDAYKAADGWKDYADSIFADPTEN